MSNIVNAMLFFVNCSTLKPTVGTTSEYWCCGQAGGAAPSATPGCDWPRAGAPALAVGTWARTFFGMIWFMIVVLPASSSPTTRILHSVELMPSAPNSFLKKPIGAPVSAGAWRCAERRRCSGCVRRLVVVLLLLGLLGLLLLLLLLLLCYCCSSCNRGYSTL